MAFVAIVTNQGGIPQYAENDFYAKLVAIKNFVAQYTMTMVVAEYRTSPDNNNKHRKLNTGMLSRIAKMYKKLFRTIEFDHDTALMIGDSSDKPGQWSDTDKKTAENFGIDYMDVEDFIRTQFK